MPFSGDTFTHVSGTLVSNGQPLDASQHTPAMNDIADALTALKTNENMSYGTLANRANFDSKLKGFKYVQTDVDPFIVWERRGASGTWRKTNGYEVNPIDFGATGDGVADDTAAFTAMLAFASATSYLIPGNCVFYVTSNVTFTKPVRFETGGRMKPNTGATVTYNEAVSADLNQWIYDISAGGIHRALRGTSGNVSFAQFGAKESLTDASLEVQAGFDNCKQNYSVFHGNSYQILREPRPGLIHSEPVQYQVKKKINIWTKTRLSFVHGFNGGFHIPAGSDADAGFVFNTAALQDVYITDVRINGGSWTADSSFSNKMWRLPSDGAFDGRQILNSSIDVFLGARYGVDFSFGYCQQVDFKIYSYGKVDQILNFFGNDNTAWVEKEGGTGTTTEPYIYCGSLLTTKGSGNRFLNCLVESTCDPNKAMLHIENTDWTEIDSPWIEPTFADVGPPYVALSRTKELILLSDCRKAIMRKVRISEGATLPRIKLVTSNLDIDYLQVQTWTNGEDLFDMDATSTVQIGRMDTINSNAVTPGSQIRVGANLVTARSKYDIQNVVNEYPSDNLLKNGDFHNLIAGIYTVTGTAPTTVTAIDNEVKLGRKAVSLSWASDVTGWVLFTQRITLGTNAIGKPMTSAVWGRVSGAAATDTYISTRVMSASTGGSARIYPGKSDIQMSSDVQDTFTANQDIGVAILNPKAGRTYELHYAYVGEGIDVNAPGCTFGSISFAGSNRTLLETSASPEGVIDGSKHSEHLDTTTGWRTRKETALGGLTQWMHETRLIRPGGDPEGVTAAGWYALLTDYTNGGTYFKNTGSGNTGWHMVLPIIRSGDPEGAVTARVGGLVLDTGLQIIYRKMSGTGNTGWMAVTPCYVTATPEGSVTARYGTVAINMSTGEHYHKKSASGNTGWKLVTTAP